MFKKIFLTISLSLISYEFNPIFNKEKYEKDSSFNNTAVITIAGIGALGTAVYWMKRETNESLLVRSRRLISDAYELVDKSEKYFYCQSKTADTCASTLLENKLLNMIDKINPLYSTVSSRYGSYLAFWNWTDQMKEIVQEFKKLTKKINENLYAFSLKRAMEFIQKYQETVFYKAELFADNKSLTEIFSQSKILNKDFFEINKKGKIIKLELLNRGSSLDFIDKKTAIDLDEILSKIHCMQIVLKYSDCALSINNSENFVRSVRKVAGISSTYPIKDFVCTLREDIQSLRRLDNNLELYVVNSIELLENILEEVVCSQEYSKERQMYEIYLEEQRKARAAETQARAAQAQAYAAQDQAYAQHRKADALKEQNRIQKERNRIERERNDIERNKN